MSEQVWGTTEERERKNRIFLSVFAYQYEIENSPVISDEEYDALSLMINPNMDTGNPIMDKFFKEEFSPSTGMWIHKHPELDKLKSLIQKLSN